MNAHELMVKTNQYLIQGGSLTAPQVNTIVRQLLAARSTESQAARYHAGVGCPGNIDRWGHRMYPSLFIPPYQDGQKLRTIFDQTPKTQLFSGNMYELEIVRLLALLAPEHPAVPGLTAEVLARLQATCFGNKDDGVGECFDASLVVLRFLATAAPTERRWIEERIANYHRHKAEKKRSWHSAWYFWLCLSELPYEMVRHEIDTALPEILPWVTTKSFAMNSEKDRIIHPVRLCVVRNVIGRMPGFAHIRYMQPQVSGRDGRLALHIDLPAPLRCHDAIPDTLP